MHNAGRIDHSHLIRIERWPLRLLSQRIVETESRGTHIPKGSAHQIALERVVVQNRCEASVGVRLRSALSEARTNGAGIRDRSLIQRAHRPSESGFGHVTEGACFIPPNRQLLIVKDELAEQNDLL